MITKDKVLDILLAMSAMSRQELESFSPRYLADTAAELRAVILGE